MHMHMCVCEACAQLLRDRCPVCSGRIERIAQLFSNAAAS
jgi:rRNA maturation endonuclease Nob1